MRSFLHIDLENKSINREELEGESIARAGRYLIAKTLLESGLSLIHI